ncbi:MAG: 50S ribosome-binding GTPase [Anaerolineae bacterium]|nr:50S ribosome-binding GTPase [Anaerolineae bacterium]
MSASTQSYHEDEAYLRAVSAFERIGHQLESIESHLHRAKSWLPGRELLAEIAWSRQKIEELQASWGHKLIVALVGPSGAGKSTLLNALAGKELSVTGRQRPTTREVIIYAQSLADAEGLARHCGADRVRVVIDHQAAGLEYLTLVDAPDTNTLPENQALLAKVLQKTDLIVTVFPATNPKMHDNIAFLRPHVQRFPEGAVIPVLNQVDRVPRAELEEVIVPDFQRTIAKEWSITPGTVFLTSAKSSAPEAFYPEDEQPLHDIDETENVKQFLADYVGSMGQVVDRRLVRAEQLLSLIRSHCSETLTQTAQERAEAQGQLSSFSQKTTRALLGEFQRVGNEEIRSAPSVALYAALSSRWWGPVGWLIGLWSILLRLASAAVRLVRRGSPIRLSHRMASNLARENSVGQGTSPTETTSEPGVLSFVLRGLYVSEWPPVADTLVGAGFDVRVRDTTRWEEWASEYQHEAVSRWREAFQGRVDATARGLAAWPLQVLLNAPTLALVVWICVETLRSFLAQDYLSADYFRQALIVVALVFVLSFVALQLLVSVFTGRRFYHALSREVSKDVTEPVLGWERELGALGRLQALCQKPLLLQPYPDFWAHHF